MPRISAQGDGRMSDTMAEAEQRVRERAYFLREREGRPEGRAEEHWRRAAAKLEAATRDDREGRRTDAEEAGATSASAAPPHAARTAAKHRAAVGAGEGVEGEGVEAAPGVKRAPSDGSSPRRAEPVDRAARSEAAQRHQRPRQRSQAAPRGSRRKDAAVAEVSARAPSESDEGGSRPPPR